MTLCGDIIITGDIADKCPQYTGVFHVTDRMCCGKLVFVNEYGKILYSANWHELKDISEEGNWHIGNSIGEGVTIISAGAPICPGDSRVTLLWQYLDGSFWRNSNASVTCSVQDK